jgi:hypothetical protein
MLARRDSASRLGAALESEELVSREELRAALEYQIQQLFHRLFCAKDATFTFGQQPDEDDDGRIRMNVTQLLLESARTLDESRSH